MLRSGAVVAGIMLIAVAGSVRAVELPKLFAAGEWSEPVVDADGYSVRGRLVLYERVVAVGGRAHFPRQDRREVSVYVELQDASAAVGRSMRMFCDFGKTEFRAEYKGGFDCELLDKDKRPIPSAIFAFGGGSPGAEWVTLPSDATIRLRCSPFGVHRAEALAISPQLGKLWVIADGDPNEYFLSGTFTVDPGMHLVKPVEQNAAGGAAHVWSGTIALPPVRIMNQHGAATSQPHPATTQPGAAADDDPNTPLATTLAPSHGLWLNGAFPKVDSAVVPMIEGTNAPKHTVLIHLRLRWSSAV